jgi:2-amino-4-hydroxy-6-hydroxymethyldihydropteridine diphosphokinase / dihydropteroate synthase
MQNHPSGVITFQEYLKKLDALDQNAKQLITPLTFLNNTTINPLTPLLSSRRTQIMSILNFTPDSFSDGGIHSPANPTHSFTPSLLSTSDVIDIGGESTRPGAATVSSDEELARVLPAVHHAAAVCTPAQAISIDTYHTSVAGAALRAGAHVVNDISAGRLDADMFAVAASHGASVVLTHSRGTPQSMMAAENLDYGSDLLGTIARELAERVCAAERAGIRRWRIILDPGLGFAKTFAQNIEIVRGLEKLREYPELVGLPWLIGLSRKSFVRRVAEAAGGGDMAAAYTNAAFLMAAMRGGADIIRVHDPVEARILARVADALWRNRDPLDLSDSA